MRPLKYYFDGTKKTKIMRRGQVIYINWYALESEVIACSFSYLYFPWAFVLIWLQFNSYRIQAQKAIQKETIWKPRTLHNARCLSQEYEMASSDKSWEKANPLGDCWLPRRGCSVVWQVLILACIGVLWLYVNLNPCICYYRNHKPFLIV